MVADSDFVPITRVMGAPKVDPKTLYFVRRLGVEGDTELGLTA